MPLLPIPNRRQALLTCLLAATAAVACAALLTAAALAPAPPGALPLLIVVCVGFPLIAGWELPVAVAVLRQRTAAVGDFRRTLAELPETEHPLGY